MNAEGRSRRLVAAGAIAVFQEMCRRKFWRVALENLWVLGSPLRPSATTETGVGAVGGVRSNLGARNKLRAIDQYR